MSAAPMVGPEFGTAGAEAPQNSESMAPEGCKPTVMSLLPLVLPVSVTVYF